MELFKFLEYIKSVSKPKTKKYNDWNGEPREETIVVVNLYELINQIVDDNPQWGPEEFYMPERIIKVADEYREDKNE